MNVLTGNASLSYSCATAHGLCKLYSASRYQLMLLSWTSVKTLAVAETAFDSWHSKTE